MWRVKSFSRRDGPARTKKETETIPKNLAEVVRWIQQRHVVSIRFLQMENTAISCLAEWNVILDTALHIYKAVNNGSMMSTFTLSAGKEDSASWLFTMCSVVWHVGPI